MMAKGLMRVSRLLGEEICALAPSAAFADHAHPAELDWTVDYLIQLSK